MGENGYKIPLLNRILNLQKSSSYGILSYLFIPLVLWLTFPRDFINNFIITYFLFFSVIAIYRFYLTFEKISLEYEKQLRWIRFFYFITIIQTLLLGGFVFIILHYYPVYSFHSFFITMAVFAYSIASALTLAAFPSLANIYSGISLLMLGTGLYLNTSEEFRDYYIFGILIFYAITNILVRRHYNKIKLIEELYENQKLKIESTSQFINNLPGVVSIFDENLQYFDCNDQLVNFLKISKSDIIGKPLGFINNNPIFVKQVEEFYHSGESKSNFEMMLNERNFICFLIKNNTTAGYHISTLSIDITELRKKEKQLERQKMELIESEKLLTMGELASGLAHEINNPMAIILGRIQVMQKKIETIEAALSNYSQRFELEQLFNFDFFKSNMSKMIEVSHRIKKIVQSLKIIGKDTTHTVLMDYSSQDVLDPLMALYHHRLFFNGIEFIFENNYPLEVIKCDLAELSQVVLYIIKYSIKVLENKDEKWLRVEVHEESGCLQFWFIHSGNKLTDQQHQFIFSKSMQSSIALTEFELQKIVGLVSAQELLVRQNGQLEYKADYPNSCFIISLQKSV